MGVFTHFYPNLKFKEKPSVLASNELNFNF